MYVVQYPFPEHQKESPHLPWYWAESGAQYSPATLRLAGLPVVQHGDEVPVAGHHGCGDRQQQAEIMMRIASEFGFTSASRSRISVPAEREPTLFDFANEENHG